MSRTLYVTVGGSPPPVLTAVRNAGADHVVFVCSCDDPLTRKRGTWTLIRGEGNVCSSQPNLPPDLPAIPAQLRLPPERWEILEVPADEPVEATRRIQARMQTDLDRGADVLVDYTGGTKSMSAAAFFAATLENAEIQLVTGPRVDHLRVRDRMEVGVHLDTTGLAEMLALRAARTAWGRHDYRDAANTLATLTRPSREAVFVLALSRGLTDWDDFRYADALTTLEHLARFVPRLMAPLGRLRNSARDGRQPDPLQGYDLWLAAERRAVLARYDQAVLLLYRCLEWIAQWSLREHHGIDASDVATDRADVASLGHRNHHDRLVLPLHAAWTALERLDGPMREAAKRTAKARLGFTQLRNESILAHGVRPLDRPEFESFRGWMHDNIIPDFVTHGFGREPMPQLPTSWPVLGETRPGPG